MLHFAPPTWELHPPRRWQVEALARIAGHYAAADPAPAVVSAIMGAGKSLLLAELAATVQLGEGEVVVVSTSSQLLVEQLRADLQRRCGMARSVGTWYGRRKRMAPVIVVCVPSVGALADRLRAAGRTVALWVADECHRSECSTVLSAQAALAPRHSLGLTATAFRSSGTQSLSLFETVIYRYGVAEAQADGVVVPWRILHHRAGDPGSDLDAVCLEMARGAEGPGLANARDIEDAEDFARVLTEHGIDARAVHSKQRAGERANALKALQRGQLRAVVHVDLLTEGANYPWLRWLLLRRRVGARVRFVQEVGRLLRSAPGKDIATFYDVHDLFGEFRLSYEEALGEPPAKDEPDPLTLLGPEAVAERIESDDTPAALTAAESVVRALVVAADAHGMLAARKKLSREKRQEPCDPMQAVVLQRQLSHVGKYVPESWRPCIEATVGRARELRHGVAADLMAVLDGVFRLKRWPPVNTELTVGGAA